MGGAIAAISSIAQVAGAIGGVASGFASARAYKRHADYALQAARADREAAEKEAQQLDLQARIAKEEALTEANRTAKNVRKFEARQRMQYLAQGVSVEAGSPLLVFDETLRDGQEEVNALVRRGNATSKLYNLKAEQARTFGLAALIRGEASAAASRSQASTSIINGFTNLGRIGLFSGKGSGTSGSQVSATGTGGVQGTFASPLFGNINNRPAPIPDLPSRLFME